MKAKRTASAVKKTSRKSKKKATPVKTKKLTPKQLSDSLSETISFVIKGKLTPMKAAVKPPPTTTFKRQSRRSSGTVLSELQDEEKPEVEEEQQQQQQIELKSKSKETMAKSKPANKRKGVKMTKGKKVKPANTRKSPNKRSKARKVKRPPRLATKVKSESQPQPPSTRQKLAIKQEPPLKVEDTKRIVRKRSTRSKNPPTKPVKRTRKIKKELDKAEDEKPELGKIKSDRDLNSDENSTNSDEITLDLLRQQNVEKKLEEIKEEPPDEDKNKKLSPPPSKTKPPVVIRKKKIFTNSKEKIDKIKKRKSDQRRKMKLFALWNGPKRHRVASLNALAKVHCLYENETRGNLIDNIQPIKKEVVEKKPVKEEISSANIPARNLRTAPGLRGVGKHWDMHDTMSSSEDTGGESSPETEVKPKKEPPIKKVEEKEKKPPIKRRKRTEIIMDLKDMVVRKRMASLNASAILAASYSLEKNASRSPKSSSDSDSDSEVFSDGSQKKKYEEDVKKEDKLIEVCATPNKKVAVILNQDTDVTITGVYVNSTTRSTHHEGYCSIAGMQYRISATSHTQTAATAVATETLLQSASSSSQENSNSESTPSKSYTPLDALSNMQPPSGPGAQHAVQLPHHHLGPPHISPQLSPLPRRHGCPSAFSAPPGHYPSTHHHPPPPPPPPAHHGEQGYMHGYYQPAGPLINVPHGHTQPPPLGKSGPLSETSSVSPPPTQPPPAPSSAGDSSDNDVIITSVTSAKDASPPQQTYRLGQYPTSAHSAYSYGYPTHYYHTPHHAPPYPHHDLCYSPNTYIHKTYPYRRYLVGPPPSAQYFQPSPPDLYSAPPPPAPPPNATQQNQQVVTATSSAAGSASSYQSSPSGPPPAPPTILESYPPPPPPTLVESYPPPYYAGYVPPPPPPCYSHSPTRSTLPYINATYQNCPCPIQSCPKNVHTGPLIGNNKRSNISSITKDSILLQPVALALPMEPASATGPPSPARGSAGMPPPPSPAGATYQPPPPTPKHETPEPIDLKSTEKRRKHARVGKSAVRETLHQNTMLLMCQEQDGPILYLNGVKREVESPKEDQKKNLVQEQILISKIETTKLEEKVEKVEKLEKMEKLTITIQEAKSENGMETIKEIESLKTEENEAVISAVKESLILDPCGGVMVPLEPCVKTVAENVKVKNMKRKPSINNNIKEEQPSSKKAKIEKSGGSYKDLIKKSYTTVRINNGKKKLLSRHLVQRMPKIRFKRHQTKRKRSPIKEVDVKKVKLTKPLSKIPETVSIEDKEPTLKKGKKSTTVITSAATPSTSNSNKCKKIAPAVLDNLLARNSVDRTIESVISCENRTSKNGVSNAALRTLSEKSAGGCAKRETATLVAKKTVCAIGNKSNGAVKCKTIECKKSGAAKRKTKSKSAEVVPEVVPRIPRRSLPLPKWSNGWEWKGEPYEGQVFLNSDEATVIRKCYPAMEHNEGDIIEARDCVLLKAGQRKNDLPFVAKIAALWENPEDGEMMMSLLWYYRPEHTEQGRLPFDQPDEVFASRHKDSNSVACIEDKCYVLTFNEYCRYRKNMRRLEEGMEDIPPCIPSAEMYPRLCRQPPNSIVTPPEMVFFCRRVYDFRQKRIVKNPS